MWHIGFELSRNVVRYRWF